MQSIGERLGEARKRKGISLREAAEATKIRGDFLGSIEQNKFDFDLPDIYKRGFLKNYARYLKLDVDKILTDYNAQQLSNTRIGRKSGSEWFGQMDLKSEQREEEDALLEREPGQATAPSLGRIKARASKPVDETEDEDDGANDGDKTFYLKVGLIFVGTLALVFVIFGLLWAILGSGGDQPDPVAPELRDSSTERVTPSQTLTGGDNAAPATSDSVTLSASGNVYVLVKQRNDNQELFRKTMSAGETVSLDKEGPVDILFTAGEHLTVEHGGERMRPSSAGTAKITIP